MEPGLKPQLAAAVPFVGAFKHKIGVVARAQGDAHALADLLASVDSSVRSHQLAKHLLRRFGTLRSVLYADEQPLAAALPDAPQLVRALISFSTAHRTAGLQNALDQAGTPDLLGALQHCSQLFRESLVQNLHVLFFREQNGTVRGETLFRGDSAEVRFLPREIIKRAIELQATSILLTHNHPSSSSLPSPVELMQTRDLREACRVVGIGFIDHVIVGYDGYYSFRSSTETRKGHGSQSSEKDI